VSIITTKTTGVIIGAINIERNVHDSKTLQPALEQQQRLAGIILKNNFVDRGYRGVKEVLGTTIVTPDKPGKLSLIKNKSYGTDLSAVQRVVKGAF
jgi:IS5 family transposase